RATPYPWRALESATIDVWMVAPAFDPASAYVVAAVNGPAGNFAVPLDLDPDLWTVDPEAVIWLGTETYPSPHAKRAGRLQVTGHPRLAAGELARYVDQAGVGAVENAGTIAFV